MAEETKTQKEKKQRAFMSLRAKILFGLTLLFSVLFLVALAWFNRLARDIALRRLEEDIEGTLHGATEGVDTEALVSLANEAHALAGQIAEEEGVDLYRDLQGRDVFETAGDFSDEDKEQRSTVREIYARVAEELRDDPRFEALMDFEQQIRDIEPRAWPYIYVPGPGPGEAYLAIADLWLRYDPDRAFDFLYYSYSGKGYLTEAFAPDTGDYPDGIVRHNETIPDNSFTSIWERIQQRFQGLEEDELEPIWDRPGYDDEWGTWISAYAPIYDEAGDSIGAMGIDFRAEYVEEVIGQIQRQVLAVFGIGYVVLLIAAFGVASAFANPISALAASAERIGEGHYDEDIADMSVGPFRDELTVFADVFEIMIGKVHKREQSLRRQVEELRIQIDEKKRSEQVAEIVDTDFFRDLRTKARTMRSRGKPTDREEED